MANQLLNKFKNIDLSRRRLKGILENKGLSLSTNSLPGLVESVNELVPRDYVPKEWNGVAVEEMPTDYYVPEIDIDAIYEADTDKGAYTGVILYLIDCTEQDVNLPQNAFSSFQKYKFSDTNTLVNPAKNTESPAHTWDKSKDIFGESGRKYRWVIGYTNAASPNIAMNGQYFTLDALVVYKGAFNIIYFRDTNNTPAYIELKPEVTNAALYGHDIGINTNLKTVISNAPNATIADSAFKGCRELRVVNWNSVSNSACSYSFQDCDKLEWLYIKQTTNIGNGTFVGVSNCYIQIDTITGGFGTTSSGNYPMNWPLSSTSNLRIKIGQLTNLYQLAVKRGTRDGLYYATGENYLEIDNLSGGTTYDCFNAESYAGPMVKINHIENCTLSRLLFRYAITNPEMKFSGTIVFAQYESSSNTFQFCDTIKKLDFSDANVAMFYHYAFDHASNLETLILPKKGLTALHAFLIRSTKVKSLVVPDTVTSINGDAFTGSHLESLHLGNGITSLPAYLLSGQDKLVDLILPENITIIDTAALLNTASLQSIVIPESVKRLGIQAFDGSGIQSVELRGTDIIINHRCFRNCKNLTTINLENVAQIDDYAFEGTNIEELVIPANEIVLSANALVSTNAKCITFAEGFTPVGNINISYSGITEDTVLKTLYSLPDLTNETARTLTIGPTNAISTATAGYTFYDMIKNKNITINEDGLVWDEGGTTTVAEYVASKNWTVV